MEKVYVDAVEIQSPLTANNQVNLIVRGNLPSPAYHLDKVNVQVIGNDIEITPLAVVAKNIVAAQVLVPFEKTIAVKVDKPGPYRVHLNGRTQSVIHEITLR